ncbi:6841_t:CDS:2 [Entrophospora sp. SA101]|nr:6841_t:CDS:2 [Entrophospora sp. SA101]
MLALSSGITVTHNIEVLVIEHSKFTVNTVSLLIPYPLPLKIDKEF